MDHFDITTGVLDSWDLLNCPVLATCANLSKEKLRENSSEGATSSTSVLLHTETYTPVLNSISAGYYPLSDGTYKICPSAYDKPLIQVTVIPKLPQGISNFQRRRKPRTKKPALPTLSAVRTKNIYVLIPGRKKAKVYAIDTTNAKIFKEINDNILLSGCMIKSYFRAMNKSRKKSDEKAKDKREQLKYIPECSPGCAYLLNKKTTSPDRSGLASPRSPIRSSYKMVTKIESNTLISSGDRRTDGRQIRSPDRVSLKDTPRINRQKTQTNIHQKDKANGKEEVVKSPDRLSYISDKRSIESMIAETKRRSPTRLDKSDPNASRPGRIRITGRLGLTEDDRCILKCNATLNDKPIETQFQGEQGCTLLPTCFQSYNEDFRSTRKRDANVQVEAKESPIGVRFYTRKATGMESQATQVDFQLLYSSAKDRWQECSRGKTLQKCACVNTVENFTNASDDEDTGLKKQAKQSPIVVISVYSKNGDPGDIKGAMKQNDTKMGQKKDSKKVGRSRSPSPAKNSKKIGSKKSEGRVTASSSKKTIRESAKKETRSKANQSHSKSVIRSTTITKNKTESKTNKNKIQKSQKSPPQSRRSKSPEVNPDESKVNEQMIKKAIIEDFTKNYADHIIQRKEIPLTKHNVSNITIDIEGDSDYYNVKLEQDVGKVNTELTVRRPNRGKRAGEVATRETDSTSLENFLYVQPYDGHGPRKRSFSQTLMYDGTDVVIKSDTSNNELNVRDSIEISHRRDYRGSLLDGKRERNDLSKEVNTEYSYLAANKHFQGDNCRISDPNVRDKEIRRLLGVDKGIKQPQSKLRSPKTTTLFGKSGEVPLHTTCDSSSPTSQIKNSKTVLRKLDINERTDSLYDTVKTVRLNRPLYELTWNQNVQLLYQLNFRKKQPIVLTRLQYAKVKKTIYNTLIQRHNNLLRAKWSNHNRRLTCSIGRAETKNIVLHYDKECQTVEAPDVSSMQAHIQSTDQFVTMMSDIDTYSVHEIPNCGDGSTTLSIKRNNICVDSSLEVFEHSSSVNWNQHAIKCDKYVRNVQRTVLIARDLNRPNSNLFKEEFRRKSTSVKEIQYKTVASTKHKVKLSSSDIIGYKSRGQYEEKKDSCSIHTIFKSQQKSITPKVGAYAISLCDVSSEGLISKLKVFDDSIKHYQKPKKPFLRRLISCLAFKISPVSQPKKVSKKPRLTAVPNSSFDSYHISTSLGAIEMSSSMYDTTASFYSDHTIQPVAKMKRGFFSSVKGFLGCKS